ncbi:hypothetical protein [Formosa sp. A9]|uniref:hypothetical protein n=1 Tax=Formosa sp. A9 TaxID=3442641 RepID=UPI003EBED76C
MRVLFIIVFIWPFVAFAQKQSAENTVRFSANFSTYLKYDNNLGTHFLGDATEAKFPGFGFQFDFLKYQNLKFGLGVEFMPYDVVDITMAGNIDKTDTRAYFGKFLYEIKLGESWRIAPNLGIGSSIVRQKTSTTNLDSFKGIKYYAGTNITYKLTEVIGLFLGVNYAFAKYNVNTAEAFESYFRNSTQMQILFGLSFTVPNKK